MCVKRINPQTWLAREPTRGIGVWVALFAAIYGLLAVPAIFASPPWDPADLTATGVLAVVLIMLSAIDVRALRLPDALTLTLTVAGVALAAGLGWDTPQARVIAALAGFGALYVIGWIYERIRGRVGLGMGDAKLLAAAGAWLGLEGLVPVVLWASALGLLAVAVAALRGAELSRETALPFGPFLALGIWIVWLFGPLL